MKKAIILLTIAAVCFGLAVPSFAADKDTAKKAAVATAPAAAQPVAKAIPAKMPRANFSMLYGTVTKIDTSDPANVKLEIKNEADNTTHTIDVVPATNVTKVTAISELKEGENVRVMARKVDSKEVAIGVMFGKIRKPAPRPAAPSAALPAVAATKAPEQTKK